jgi:hypothetical protein
MNKEQMLMPWADEDLRLFFYELSEDVRVSPQRALKMQSFINQVCEKGPVNVRASSAGHEKDQSIGADLGGTEETQWERNVRRALDSGSHVEAGKPN